MDNIHKEGAFVIDKTVDVCDNGEKFPGGTDMKKWIALILALCCLAAALSGCNDIAAIAENVVKAAKEELVKQVRTTLEQYKVEVVEIKPLVGKLNDEGGQLQFFCAALIKANSEDLVQDCTEAIGKIFGNSGYMKQEGSKVESNLLVHKTLQYAHADLSGGNYYTVYVYAADLGGIVDLDAIKAKLEGK